MKEKSIFYPVIFSRVALLICAVVINAFIAKIYGQGCPNFSSALIHLENFGVGTDPVANPDVASFVFQPTGPLTEGQYRVINNTQQGPGWHASPDHTANDVDGRMLVAEGQGVTFYQVFVDREVGYFPADYSVTLYAMNLDPPGMCEGSTKLPAIMIGLDYLSADNQYVSLTGTPYLAPALEQSADPAWVNIGATFSLPYTGTFLVKNFRLWLADATSGGPGCGNDFAVDDITLSQCPTADPVPVTFLNITARQKGSGVSVEWSTAQEFNNKFFIVEKSSDGNTNWNIVSSINAIGGSTVKNYNAYDAQPFKGFNYYRVKQVDADGNFKYSKTIILKLATNKTRASVIANPFHNSLTVDFLSPTNQVVFARLTDITGRLVVAQKWSINTGTSRKEFPGVSGLQNGMYILTVSGANGEIFYKDTIVKE